MKLITFVAIAYVVLIFWAGGLAGEGLRDGGTLDIVYGSTVPPFSVGDCGPRYEYRDPCHFGWAPDGSSMFQFQQLMGMAQQVLGVRDAGDIALGS